MGEQHLDLPFGTVGGVSIFDSLESVFLKMEVLIFNKVQLLNFFSDGLCF